MVELTEFNYRCSIKIIEKKLNKERKKFILKKEKKNDEFVFLY